MNEPKREDWEAQGAPVAPLDARVTLLINYITKHQEVTFAEALRWLPKLTCLLSVWIEPQRDYQPELGQLPVVIQKNWTFRRTWKHAAGFADEQNIQIPYDTWFQLRRLKPDVIVSYELGARSLLSALYRLTHRRSRLALAVFVSEHTERSYSGLRRWARRRLLACADVVTFEGTSCWRYLRQLGVPENKLVPLCYTADPRMLHHGSTDRPANQRHRLLFVGQLTARKAPLQLIERLGHWCQKHPERTIELSMVGRGPLLAEIEAMPRPANLHITMLGSLPPTQLPSVLAEHGVMVFPTLADEWGMVVDEALHSGLPVLASEYAQATLELVQEGVNGWRFRPDHVDEFDAAIDRMMSCSAEQLGRMAQAGRESVARRTPAWGGARLALAVQAALQS